MAQIAITIPDASLARVVGDICTLFSYQATLTDLTGNQTPNPETQNQFAKRMLIQTIKGWMSNVESVQAAQLASAQSDATIAGVNIT